MKHWTFIASTSLLLLLSGCGKATDPGQGNQQTPSLSSSAITIASMQQVSPTFELPAAIEASQIAKPVAQVMAEVKGIYFTGGELVSRGKLLVELDDAKFVAALDIARADLLAAKAAEEEASTNWTRAQELMQTDYISQLDFDKAKAKYDTAVASIARTEAALAQAELNLSYTKIYAPFDGKISRPGNAVGDLVAPESPKPLFELVELDPIYAISSIELGQYNKFVLEQQKIEAQGGELPEFSVSLRLAGDVEYPYEGKFEAWSHSSESSRGMIAARVLVPNPDGLLLPGQIVNVIGSTRFPIERITIPQHAVFQDQEGYYVRVVDDSNVVQRANIELGIRDGANWLVKSGLEEGTKVIVDGSQSYRIGSTVSITD